MSKNNFEKMLTGGHPNSLGKTVEVVNIVLKDNSKFDELFQCYFSNDEVIRLRVSNAMKRICREKPKLLIPYLDLFLEKISKINQASTQWTLAQLFLLLENSLSKEQKEKAIKIMKVNLEKSNDWIVQNMTLETLGRWSQDDSKLKKWLLPKLEEFSKSSRKSVAGKAKKLILLLT